MMYIGMFLCGILGLILHSLFKVQNINKRTPATVGFKEILKMYLRADIFNILIGVCCIVAGLIFIGEFLRLENGKDIPFVPNNAQYIVRYLTCSGMILYGFFCNYILSNFVGKAEKLLNQNIAANENIDRSNNNIV